MNAASAEPHPAELAGTKPPGKRWWAHSRWLLLVAIVFAVHVALLFAFGGRKPLVPRAVTDVPKLKLMGAAGEWLALNDPTLFALPHRADFAAAFRRQTVVGEQPTFYWTEPPRWLRLSPDELGLVFNQFMQTNRFAGFELELKPPPQFSSPVLPPEPVRVQNSTLRIEGELAKRQLPGQINLTNWPYAGEIAPSQVQVLVDAAGNVVSTVLLPPADGFTAADQYDQADQRALELARAMRFTPAPHLTIGRLIFNWCTVPPPPTNAPAIP
jgi:hypothetical protein